MKIALIGFGAIGTPIAHKLFNKYGNNFMLVASGDLRCDIEGKSFFINGDEVRPKVISDKSETDGDIDLLLVCVKNYDLITAIDDIKNIISDKTVILPLQNGIFSYNFFCKNFPANEIIMGYVQGPNTRRQNDEIFYSNPGDMYIGKTNKCSEICIKEKFSYLSNADIHVHLSEDIEKNVWKKWMLNVVGNSVTALTGADYSMFKGMPALQDLCRNGMNEFMKVAVKEGVNILTDDIDDVINYYVGYRGSKKTSMLEDVLNLRRTENEFLAGDFLQLAKKHSISTPTIQLLYELINIKEEIYLSKK